MKKILTILIGLVLLQSCGETRISIEYDKTFIIQSIRIDDEADYHIVAVSKDGEIETVHDSYSDGYGIKIKYDSTYTEPTLIKHLSNRKEIDFYKQDGDSDVYLPFGYIIETFTD